MSNLEINLPWDVTAEFVRRPNRFVVTVELENGEKETAHLHDPGRLNEILRPGAELLLKNASSKNRKTRFDVVAGRLGGDWVLINSAYHRTISEAVLSDPQVSPIGEVSELKAEVKVGRSRLDFTACDKKGIKIFIEVKGCSLTRDGKALFPDAPTGRGRRHLEELTGLVGKDRRAAVIILVLGPEASCFAPNAEMDPEFALAFHRALDAGVEIYPMQFLYDGGSLRYLRKLPICGLNDLS